MRSLRDSRQVEQVRPTLDRLSGLDAGFLYMEAPPLSMHTLKVLVFEPEPRVESREAAYSTFLELLSRGLPRIPSLRQRLVWIRFGLAHPRLEFDPDFDLRHHVQRAELVRGDRAELDALVAEFASEPLDRAHPLWRVIWAEGLEGGRTAVVIKIHHALADGAAAMRLISAFLADRPAEDEDKAEDAQTIAKRDLWHDVLRTRGRQLAELPSLLRRTAAGVLELSRTRITEGRNPQPVRDAPRTPFNRPLTSERAFSSTALPLEHVRRIHDSSGVTLNDVMMTIAAGALRTYLAEENALPSGPLLASVPTSSETEPSHERVFGNKVSNVFVQLPTHLADPIERLHAIRAATTRGKARQRMLGRDLMEAWAEHAHPWAYLWSRLWGFRLFSALVPPPVNVIVSNVHGPREPLYAGGHRMNAIYSVGPVLHGVGLNITFWSYGAELEVGVLSCRNAIPRPEVLTRAMHTALSELLVATENGAPRDVPPSRSSTSAERYPVDAGN